jgi:hypothetical protein
MARRPQKVVSSDFVNLSLHDPTFDERLQSLLKVSAALVTHTDLGMLLPAVGEGIRGIANYNYGSLALREGAVLRMYPLASRLGQGVIRTETAVPLLEAPAGRAMLDRAMPDKETKFFKGSDLAAVHSPFARRVLQAGVQSLCCIPLKSAIEILFGMTSRTTPQAIEKMVSAVGIEPTTY